MSRSLKLLSFLKKFQTLRRSGALLIVGFVAVLLKTSTVQAEFGSIVDVGVGGDLYFTNSSANNGQGFVNLLIQNTWSSSQLWLDVGAGGLVADTADSYVKMPQFYYRLGHIGKSHLTIGRALYDWSFADEFWNLGVTQPIFKWNEARPETQGLTGVFVSIPLAEKTFELTLFGSLLYIPTQGPSYELSNGKITSSNPWFNEPVEVINLNDEKAELTYDIDVPKTREVISQKSWGFLLGTPINKRGWLFNSFYLNKPRNELLLPFEGALNLTTFNGDITVLPRVATHQVAGVDIGWNFNNYKTVLSWIYEGNIDYDIPAGTTFPILPDQNIFSATQLFRISPTQKVWFGYIKVDRQPTKIGGTFASSQISTFLGRNRFEEAMQLKWEGLLFKTQSLYRVNASLAYTQSINNDNIWLSSDIRWSISKGLELFNRCDFFGGSEEFIIGSDYMSTYQNNDRCFVGGHYAF